MLIETSRDMGAMQAVDQCLSREQPILAFSHLLYLDGDPRAAALLAQFQPEPVFEEIRSVVENLTGEAPNIDFALAALTGFYALPDEAPFVIFAFGRMVGWIAHCAEQVSTEKLIPREHITLVAS